MSDVDYIIIGGGSSGSAACARLAEDPATRVLVLEAGRADSDPWIHVPATFFRVIEKGRDVVFYKSVAEPALNDRASIVPQGYVLGGGSSVNAMIYIRGNARDYDLWAQSGNNAWSYDKVLPVFRDLEDNARVRDAFHGSGGPLHISDGHSPHPLSRAFVAAALQAGLPASYDFNGARQEGIGYYQTTTYRGRRWSAAAAFLRRVKSQPNVEIRTGARCAGLLFDGHRVVGVSLPDGTQFRCKREVILCAGAIESPRLLQISGIGNAHALRALGIEPVCDLPGVGENYQDHLETPVQAETAGTPSLLGQDKGLAGARHMLRYLLTRKGLLASNVVEAGGFANVMGGDTPDIQFHVLPLIAGFADRAPELVDGITINPCTLRPQSRGSVKLQSPDPHAPALFTSGMMSDDRDMETQLRGVELALRILAQPALSAIVTRRILPVPQAQDRAALAEHIRNTSKTVFHPSGTCKMGPATDRMAVVAQDLRVHGIDGLRVGDASIMPALISGNTNAPSIMIGDRCARFAMGRERLNS